MNAGWMNEGKDEQSTEIIRQEGPTMCTELSCAEGFRWIKGGWEEARLGYWSSSFHSGPTPPTEPQEKGTWGPSYLSQAA